MAKKQRDEVPNPNNVANRDIIQRLNFLYQASVYLKGIDAPPSSSVSTQPGPSNPRKRRKHARSMTAADLSLTYINDMRSVGKKSLVRMDPTVKRTLCKNCNVVLIPGITARVRVKGSSSHGHAVTYSCLDCNTARRIPAPPTADYHTHNATDPPEPLSTPQVDQQASTHPQSLDGDAIMEDPLDAARPRRPQRRKKVVRPRVPPLFARDVGHVIFRGNERLGSTEDHAVNITNVAEQNQ